MVSLMGQTKLIPGFRFHPTDVELVKYFLKRKVMGKKFCMDVIAEVDIYKYAPWDLPDKSSLQVGDLEWYFFCPKGTKYARGARMNRATEVGYWKTTGKDRPIQHNNQIVGTIKTLVFHIGRAPRGDRTNWVMHEYKLEDKELTDKAIPQDSYMLCKVFQKDGPGPRNGAHYGKPFNEEEWETDEEPSGEKPVLSAALPAADSMVPATQYNSIVSDLHHVDSKCIEKSSVTCLLGPKLSSSPSPCRMADSSSSDRVISYDKYGVSADNVMAVMLDYFEEDNTLAFCGNNNTEVLDNCGRENNANGMPCFDINDFFKDLGDLDDLSGLGEDEHHSTFDQQAENSTSQMFPNLDYDDFLKLDDLDFPLFNMEHSINLIENEKEGELN